MVRRNMIQPYNDAFISKHWAEYKTINNYSAVQNINGIWRVHVRPAKRELQITLFDGTYIAIEKLILPKVYETNDTLLKARVEEELIKRGFIIKEV